MPSAGIVKELTSGIYYLTFTVRNWYYIFDRHNRFQILADSLKYCQENKGVKIYAYVFMINHLHLIASGSDMIGFVRDFKRHTSEDYLIQKINYIHENPVRRQYVKKLEHWMWSSANPNNDSVIEPMVL
jgi:REP element-mobilizing transposase RayT